MKKCAIAVAAVALAVGATGCAFWDTITYNDYFSKTTEPPTETSYSATYYELKREAFASRAYDVFTDGQRKMTVEKAPPIGEYSFYSYSELYSPGTSFYYDGERGYSVFCQRPHFYGYYPYRQYGMGRPYRSRYRHHPPPQHKK